MRSLLSIAIFIFTGLLGYLAWLIYPHFTQFETNADWQRVVSQIRSDFKMTDPKLGYIDSSQLSKFFLKKEFFEPGGNLPRTFDYRKDDIAELLNREDSCVAGNKIKDARLMKAAQFASHICSGNSIEMDYFEKAPYYHPFGHSFAYLYFKKNKMSLNADHQKNLMTYMHVLEILEDTDLLKIAESSWIYLLNLSQDQLKAFIDGEPVFYSKRYIFIQDEKINTRYSVHLKSNWTKHFNQNSIVLKFTDINQNCGYTEHSICFQTSLQPLRSHIIPTLVALTIFGLFIFILFSLKTKRRKRTF